MPGRQACNYNADATDERWLATYAEDGYDCDGNCLNDTDSDGVCDEFEIAGCQDDSACNYNADATDATTLAPTLRTGGVCDEFEVATDSDCEAEDGYDCCLLKRRGW